MLFHLDVLWWDVEVAKNGESKCLFLMTTSFMASNHLMSTSQDRWGSTSAFAGLDFSRWIFCCDVLQFLCETYIQNGRLGNDPWVIRKCCNDFWWSLVKWRKGSGSLVGGRGASLQKGPWSDELFLWFNQFEQLSLLIYRTLFVIHCMGGCKKLR